MTELFPLILVVYIVRLTSVKVPSRVSYITIDPSLEEAAGRTLESEPVSRNVERLWKTRTNYR